MRIFILIFTLIFTLEAKSLFSNNEQADASKYIGALKNLVIATQKTRGLTNSYLNGNITSMLLVYGTRTDMKRAIGTMESLPLSTDPIISTRATNISQALIKLNHKAFKTKDPAAVFAKYTELIGQTLMLAQTVSKRGSKELNPIGKELSTIMMETILPYTEYVGQMRGMGSGLVAKKKVTKAQKDKMLAIINEIETLSSKLIIEMKLAASKHKGSFNSFDIDIKLKSINVSTRKYIAMTEDGVLHTENIELNADAYFDRGTALITLLIDVYDVNNKIIIDDSKGWL